MHRTSWDDLRYVLAVHDTGTISGAARLLGVNHATVLRRIAQFEEAHGSAVFERLSHGYRLLPDKAAVIEAGREAQDAIHLVEALMAGSEAALSGTVRITSTDTLCAHVMPRFAGYLSAVDPNMDVELLCSNNHADLSRLEADIAVRPALELPDMLIGEKCAELGFAIYARSDAPDVWLGVKGALRRSAAARALEGVIGAQPVAASADSFLVLARLAQEGLGRTILPCFVGDRSEGLERLGPPLEAARVPLWVTTHRDLRQTPRLRQAQRHLLAFLSSCSDELSGAE